MYSAYLEAQTHEHLDSLIYGDIHVQHIISWWSVIFMYERVPLEALLQAYVGVTSEALL